MNEMTVFKNSEFGELGVMLIAGKEYFPATACAKILGYTDPYDAVKRHTKGSVKHRVLTSGGEQEQKYIPEGDLYRLIIRSKLPAAERFERWVFDEVLPTIRKQGSYVTMDKLMEVIQLTVAATVAEAVKQLVPAITQAVAQQPQSQNVLEVPCPRDYYPYSEPYRPTRGSSIISRLIPELRTNVEGMIRSPIYTQDDVVSYLYEHGVQLSRMAVSRYASQMIATGRM